MTSLKSVFGFLLLGRQRLLHTLHGFTVLAQPFGLLFIPIGVDAFAFRINWDKKQAEGLREHRESMERMEQTLDGFTVLAQPFGLLFIPIGVDANWDKK